jgi:hypothetical protein
VHLGTVRSPADEDLGRIERDTEPLGLGFEDPPHRLRQGRDLKLGPH